MSQVLLTAEGYGWGFAGPVFEVAAIDQLLRDFDLPTPKVIVDVGAHKGNWTQAALDKWPEAHIAALEPSELLFGGLVDRFRAHDRVSVVRVALGAADGDGELWFESEGSPHASLSILRFRHRAQDSLRGEVVAVRTAESFARQAGLARIDLLKLDVEGLEMDILSGAPKLLERATAVQFEWGEAGRGRPHHFADLWELLGAAGFLIFRVTPRGPLRVNCYSGVDEIMMWTNYIALRPSLES